MKVNVPNQTSNPSSQEYFQSRDISSNLNFTTALLPRMYLRIWKCTVVEANLYFHLAVEIKYISIACFSCF